MRYLICLLICATLSASEVVFVEEGGLVVIEAESLPATEGWLLESATPGFSGAGYLRWDGGNRYNAPGAGLLSYRIHVGQAGRYHMRLRMNHQGAERHDLANDCWTRMDEGPWIKTYHPGGTIDQGFTFHCRHEPGHGKPHVDPVYELSAGEHVLAISGRSQGLRLDRIILYRDGVEDAQDLAHAESTGLPQPPRELTGKPLVMWQAGALGRVWSWAEREDDDPVAQSCLRVLRAHLRAQETTISERKASDPVAALSGMRLLIERYDGCDEGKRLARLAKDWSREPAVRDELKAAAIAEQIAALQRQRDAERDERKRAGIESSIAKGLALLERRYPDSRAWRRHAGQAVTEPR